ncbi:hypothetical protein D3C80_2062060 [compost metagenome]
MRFEAIKVRLMLPQLTGLFLKALTLTFRMLIAKKCKTRTACGVSLKLWGLALIRFGMLPTYC